VFSDGVAVGTQMYDFNTLEPGSILIPNGGTFLYTKQVGPAPDNSALDPNNPAAVPDSYSIVIIGSDGIVDSVTQYNTLSECFSPPLDGCLEFNYTPGLIQFDTYYQNPPSLGVDVGYESLLVQVPSFTGPTTNTTSYLSWNDLPAGVIYSVVFTIGGVDYSMNYQEQNVGTGNVTVSHGFFSHNGNPFTDTYVIQFSIINGEGQDISALLQAFDGTVDSVRVTAPGSC
jgi:hypothetical protein